MEPYKGAMQNFELPHRDDVDHEIVAEIERSFAESHPGMKVVFAGDHEQHLPDDVRKSVERFQQAMEQRLRAGQCGDCGAVMPGWPVPQGEIETWEPPDGWRWFADIRDPDKLVAWQCPACDAADREDGGE